MKQKAVSFSSASVNFYFDSSFGDLEKIVPKQNAIILTDEHVFDKHKKQFSSWSTIVIPAGEQHKIQATVDNIIHQLIEAGADRSTILIGVGGGVITDIAGYVAGIFMRGIVCGFVPTSILAMVDASVGGKNGIDVGLYKNMVGLIRQPSFILYDYSLLSSLPKEEWINGFAEIIKHACIKDAGMFKSLQQQKISFYQKDKKALAKLIERNVQIKINVVQNDEFEKGDRKLLNFGHTVGHAVENLYSIPHGHAVSIGMGIASKISESILGFKQTDLVIKLLKQYGLPPQFQFDVDATMHVLKTDKKRTNDSINFILLKKVGNAVIHQLTLQQIESFL